jgi:monoamine oxidase
VKTLLPYRRRVWRADGESGYVISDRGLGMTWEATDGQETQEGILISYAAGSMGRAAARVEPERRIRRAGRQAAKVWPGSAALGIPAAAATFAWATDPWAGGAWSGYRPGEIERCWVPLKETEPVIGERVVLAGEHTDRLNGYMEGAVRSGQRAARIIDGL